MDLLRVRGLTEARLAFMQSRKQKLKGDLNAGRPGMQKSCCER